MPPLSYKLKLSPKTWFSLFLTGFLFGAIVLTQFATQNIRDNRSQAANGSITVTAASEGFLQNFLGSCSVGSAATLPTGQQESTAWRSYVSFNTTLPAGATVTSASLILTENTDSTQTDFTYRIRSADWGTSLDCGDWGGDPHSGSIAGLFSTVSLPSNSQEFTIQISASTINKTGSTRYVLLSDREETNPGFLPPGSPEEYNQVNRGSRLVVNYTVPDPSPPTLNFWADSINLSYNTATTLRWTAANATSCTASNGWSNAKNSTGGSEPTGNLTSQKTYDLSCSGAGGSLSKQVVVNVGAAPPVNQPPASNPPVSKKPPAKVVPPGSGQQPAASINDLKLNFAPNSFLQGQMTLSLLIEGTGLAQNASIGKDGGISVFKTSSLLAKNTNYSLKASSRNSLVQKVGFKYVDNTAVSVAAFVTGDFNSDNSIDANDLTLFTPVGIKSGDTLYDINYDGVVNSVDYSLLLVNQGKKG